jgi:hypothetical protein
MFIRDRIESQNDEQKSFVLFNMNHQPKLFEMKNFIFFNIRNILVLDRHQLYHYLPFLGVWVFHHRLYVYHQIET